MKNVRQLIEMVETQESTLQFERFDVGMAHEIGARLMQFAVEGQMPITIDITRNGHRLFHVAMEGTSPDNEVWVERKKAVVNRFLCSSYLMSLKLEEMGKTIEQAYLISESDFAAHGGSFPIIIKDTGVVGTVTVSGLASEDDHKLVVDVLSAYLS